MICDRCQREIGGAAVCPYCGAEKQKNTLAHQLAAGTVIGDRYTITSVLGEGGFGITYLGWDRKLDVQVAIKEYFPRGYTQRITAYSNAVSITSEDMYFTFDHGKQRFLSEAKTVARFANDPGVVNVSDFIEENNTAYIVMEYLDGINLREYLYRYGLLSVDQAVGLLTPVMRALEKIHKAGVIHRDISPDNIMYLRDGQVKLMDFGCARDYEDDNHSMSVLLKKGYAPEEQYRRNGVQGPWTDVYSLCATIYRCITGTRPVEAIDRLAGDSLQAPSQLGISITPEMERVLLYGLAVRKEQRCQSMTELLWLIGEAKRAAAGADPAKKGSGSDVNQKKDSEKKEKHPKRPKIALILVSVLVIAALVVSGVIFVPQLIGGSDNSASSPTTSSDATLAVIETTASADYEADFLNTVSYADKKIGLSEYVTDDYSGKEYIHYDDDGSVSYCSAKWEYPGKVAYTAPTDKLLLEGGVQYEYGKSTVGDFIKKGYAAANDAPTKLQANASKYVVLSYNGKKISVNATNTANIEKKLSDCYVSGLDFYPDTDGVDFSYRGVSGASSLEDAIQVFGSPNAASAVYISTNSEGSKISIHYLYDNDLGIKWDFKYEPATQAVTLHSVDFHYLTA